MNNRAGGQRMGVVLCLLFGTCQALAVEDAVMLEPIEVRSSSPEDRLTIPDAGRAERMLRTLPGNVSLVPAAAYRDSAVLGLRDALSLTPGVYVQNPAGQEAAKLSIRGSGISTAFAMRGVRLLRDGLPLSRNDGYADTTWADPYGASHIEVYRGANALRYGASTLGGAINLISPTGDSHPYTGLRLEAGSRQHLRMQAQTGHVWDNGMDTYASLTHLDTLGSRDHARQDVSRFYSNLGLRYSAVAQGRLHLSIERNHQQFPGALTLAQLQTDSRQAGAGAVRVNERVALWPRAQVAYQHAWRLAEGNILKAGVFHAATRFQYPNTNLRLTYGGQEDGVAVRQEVDAMLAGRPNQFIWGVNLGWGRSHNRTFGPVYLGERALDTRDDQFEDIRGTHTTHELFAQNHWQITPTLALVASAQFVHATRDARVQVLRQPVALPLFQERRSRATYQAFSPMLGLIWQPGARTQWFANIARSAEPPTGAEFHGSTGPLQLQRARTLEIGVRGQNTPVGDRGAALAWEVAFYDSHVRHELLGIEHPTGSGRFVTTNIDATRHSGLEAGLNGRLPLENGAIDWRLAYTYSRYRLRSGPMHAGNALPGIAPHVARLDVMYRHPAGWYGGPSVELASGWYADQANSLRAPGYGIVNLTLGYVAQHERWRAFLSLRNLGNKQYAATTDYLVDAGGGDAAVFNPGLSRSVYAGVELRW